VCEAAAPSCRASPTQPSLRGSRVGGCSHGPGVARDQLGGGPHHPATGRDRSPADPHGPTEPSRRLSPPGQSPLRGPGKRATKASASVGSASALEPTDASKDPSVAIVKGRAGSATALATSAHRGKQVPECSYWRRAASGQAGQPCFDVARYFARRPPGACRRNEALLDRATNPRTCNTRGPAPSRPY
jgi:hypothetical protein